MADSADESLKLLFSENRVCIWLSFRPLLLEDLRGKLAVSVLSFL